MERHATDLVALLSGMFFLAIGGGYLAHEVSGRTLDPVWVVAVTSTTLGCAFLAATFLHRRGPGRDGDIPADAPAADATPDATA